MLTRAVPTIFTRLPELPAGLGSARRTWAEAVTANTMPRERNNKNTCSLLANRVRDGDDLRLMGMTPRSAEPIQPLFY